MTRIFTGSIVGFLLIGLVTSVAGVVEPLWFGKGAIGFVFLFLIFVIGMLASLLAVRGQIQHFEDHPGLLVPYGVIAGGLGYLITMVVTALVPEPIKTTGIPGISNPLGIVVTEMVATAVIMWLLHLLGLRIARSTLM